MTDNEIASAVNEGTITPKEAVRLLVEDGEQPIIARHFVFEALGGGSIIERNSAGEEIYEVSGKTVAEIGAAMDF